MKIKGVIKSKAIKDDRLAITLIQPECLTKKGWVKFKEPEKVISCFRNSAPAAFEAGSEIEEESKIEADIYKSPSKTSGREWLNINSIEMVIDVEDEVSDLEIPEEELELPEPPMEEEVRLNEIPEEAEESKSIPLDRDVAIMREAIVKALGELFSGNISIKDQETFIKWAVRLEKYVREGK